MGGRDSRIQVFQGQAMVVVEAAAVAAGPTRLESCPGSVACGPQQSKVGCCWWSAGVVVGAAAGRSSSSSSLARQLWLSHSSSGKLGRQLAGVAAAASLAC